VQKSKRNNLMTVLMLAILLIVGFFYRIYGLNANHSFWTDEDHVAIFARAILERGRPVLTNGYHTGIYQIFPYYLFALSAKIFGLNEFAIRFPSVVFGVLTIWAVYLLGKELFNKNVGLVAATLITFLKIEILWSRQARPYQALQFFSLLGAFFIYKLTKEKRFNWRYFLGFLGCGILASLMHGMGLVIFFVGFLYLLIFRFAWFKKKWTALGLAIPLIFSYIFRVQILAIVSQIGKTNNLFYYRVFLWHNYSLLVFLALVGFISQILQRKDTWQIPVLFLVFQGIIASFLLGQPFVRYFYIVFPFLVLLSAVGLGEIAKIISPKKRLLVLVILVLFIVAMGHKFTLKPTRIYSLNEDMQEIPEVDWKKIYGFVGEKIKQNPSSVLVTNWSDLPVWYLGEGKLDYLLRKLGQTKIEKDPVSSAFMLYSVEELKKIIEENKKGILIIDSWDDRVPDGVREFSRDNLKKELEIDRLYPVQPRLWPMEVYSWGL
jgi:4-amino-4-deoxy-L-arabinose transferase-like glycosyltransferase